MSLSNKGRPWYVIDSEILLKQSCSETQFSGIKSEEQKFLLANVSGVRENKMKIFQDILFSYLYPFRSVKDMKGTGWGIFYGLSHVFMAGDSDWHICLKWHLPTTTIPCICHSFHFMGLSPAQDKKRKKISIYKSLKLLKMKSGWKMFCAASSSWHLLGC